MKTGAFIIPSTQLGMAAKWQGVGAICIQNRGTQVSKGFDAYTPRLSEHAA